MREAFTGKNEGAFSATTMKKKKKLLAVIIAIPVLIAIGLAAWTATAPVALSVRTPEQLSDSSLANAITTQNATFVDPTGSYTFKFGFDYPNVPVFVGSRTEFKIYAALVSETITSSLTRGVGLDVLGVTVSIGGQEDSGVQVKTTFQPSIATIALESINTNLANGTYGVEARLVIATIDDGVIGYSQGATQIISFNGTLEITTNQTAA